MTSQGTFCPDRIRSIADRFGVDGTMALENVLYGESGYYPLTLAQRVPTARAFSSEHQVTN